MSEFRVDTIKDKDGNGKPNFPNGLTLNGVDPVTNSPTWSETGTAPSSLATQNRIVAYNKGGSNIVINGNMNIHQRSGSLVSNISTSGYYTADRWHFEDSMDTAVYSQIVDTTDFPTNTEFRKALKTNCTTAKTSLGVTDTVKILQKFEGQNVQVLKKGTTNAELVTVSFWVKSSLIGTYICELDDIQNSRQVSKSYTIDSANTWEYKTLTFPADTSGSLTNDNSARFQIAFWLVAGANFTSGTLNSSTWASYTSGNRAVGQVNFASVNTNSFWITGIQMEIGSIANPYEYKSYSEQLILCQRYYRRGTLGPGNGNAIFFTTYYGGGSMYIIQNEAGFNAMRISPNLSLLNSSDFQYYSYSAVWTNTTLSISNFYNGYMVSAPSDGDGRGKLGRLNNVNNVTLDWVANAELT